MTEPVSMTLRDRLRGYLHGAASLLDISGAVTYRDMREALPPADDSAAIRSYFDAAGRDIREALGDHGRD